MNKKLRAWVFHGTRRYGVHVAVARSKAAACKLVGAYPQNVGDYGKDNYAKFRILVEQLEEGEVRDYGE